MKGDDTSPLKAPALLLKTANLSNVKNNSGTLVSNCTLDDYNTPPESPDLEEESEEDSKDVDFPSPVPPPRPKRDKKVAMKSLRMSPEPSQVTLIVRLNHFPNLKKSFFSVARNSCRRSFENQWRSSRPERNQARHLFLHVALLNFFQQSHLFRTQSVSTKAKVNASSNANELKGYLHIVTGAFKGHRQSTKTRWEFQPRIHCRFVV